MRTVALLLLVLLTSLTLQFFIVSITLATGGFTLANLKQALVEKDVYTTMTTSLKNSLADSNDDQDQQTAAVSSIIDKFVTATYLQQKTETFLDDTSLWVVNKRTTPPELSFKEIKEEILKQNPELLTALKDMQSQEPSSPEEQKMTANFKSFTENDFTFKVGKNLQSIKTVYQFFRFSVYLLPIFLLLFFGGIWMLAGFSRNRIKWYSFISVLSVINSGIGLLLAKYLLTHTYSLSDTSNQFATLALDIVNTLLSLFLARLILYQNFSIAIFGGISFVLIISFFVLHKQPVTPTLPQKKKGK